LIAGVTARGFALAAGTGIESVGTRRKPSTRESQ
jgi:hypothetical protein